MPSSTTEHTVFIASPGDAKVERDALAAIVDEINGAYAPAGHRLRLLRWEDDVAPAAGRPQAAVNAQIPTYDIFVGVLWTRFGTPTGCFGSGTAEEIERALARWQDDHDLPVLLYFCSRPFWPKTLADVDQLRQVIEFRERLRAEQRAFPGDYVSETDFRDFTRKHLCLHLRQLAGASGPALLGTTGRGAGTSRIAGTSRAISDPDDVDALRGVWPRMDPALQRAFDMAYNEKRALGDAGVATSDLFASMVRLQDPLMQPFLKAIPEEALPNPIEGPIMATEYIAQERPWLSHCVSSSIRRLAEKVPAGRTLTTADVFADIAKHGTGDSVQRLRDHGIWPQHIDQVISAQGLDVVRT
jgi:hypothetical protein